MSRKISMGLAVLIAAAGLTTIAQGAAKKPARPANALTCNWPVGPNDSAQALLRRFGSQARMEDIGVGEGETERGVVIYPRDPRRRLYVLFWNSDRKRPQSVRFYADNAPWVVAGIRIGDRLASLRERNGRPIRFQQFGADYGGTLHSFEGGHFAGALGNCEPSITFSAEGELADAITGDGVTSSDHPDMGKANVRVGSLGVRFSPPPAE